MARDTDDALARVCNEISHELGTALTALASSQHVIASRTATRLPASDPLHKANEIAADSIDRIARILADVRAPPAIHAADPTTLADALETVVSQHLRVTGRRATLTMDPSLPGLHAAAPAVAGFVRSTLRGLGLPAAEGALHVRARMEADECIVTVLGPTDDPSPAPSLVLPTRAAALVGGTARHAPGSDRGCELRFRLTTL